MAQRKIVQYFDDIDGRPLDEAELHVVPFSLDGTEYFLEVSAENAELVRAEFTELIGKATKVTGTRRRRGNTTRYQNATRERNQKIRVWAQAQGYDVKDRGKIPDYIIDLYNERPDAPQ